MLRDPDILDEMRWWGDEEESDYNDKTGEDGGTEQDEACECGENAGEAREAEVVEEANQEGMTDTFMSFDEFITWDDGEMQFPGEEIFLDGHGCSEGITQGLGALGRAGDDPSLMFNFGDGLDNNEGMSDGDLWDDSMWEGLGLSSDDLASWI